jgi:SAM-dependent methyltransferase
MVLVVEARYDAVADFYAEGWPDSGDDPVARALLRLCGDVAGERVLDLACGRGRIARQLAGRGAIVTGIDISAALIAKAAEAERRQPAGIRYLQADAAAADWLPGARFDLAVCSFGLSDIDDLDGALASVARVTRAGGRFVFSVLHPAFPAGRTSAAPGPPPAPTTTRDGGGQTGRHPRCGGRSGRTTGPCPPISTRRGGTACGWTPSSSRPRRPNGRAPAQTPPACPSSWWHDASGNNREGSRDVRSCRDEVRP